MYGIGKKHPKRMQRSMGTCNECGKEIVRFVSVKIKRKKGAQPIEIFGTTPGPQIKFCGDTCRTNYHNQRRVKAAHPMVKCEVCSAPIVKHRFEQRFCSDKCRMMY